MSEKQVKRARKQANAFLQKEINTLQVKWAHMHRKFLNSMPLKIRIQFAWRLLWRRM
jgi:hypothetical protein